MNRRQKLVQQQFLNNEKRIIKRLDQVYAQALKDVNGNIERLMKRFNPDTGDLPQSAVYQLQYQNMIKDQLEGILNQLHTQQFTGISDYLDTCYEDGFIGGIFDLHGQGVPLMMPLDQEAMVTAVQLDSKISQGLYTRLGEDVSMLKKRITAEVSRSIATGATFTQTAVNLKNRTRIGYNNAIRIARTEGHRIQNQATMNVMELAKERGADEMKQWDSTLDGLTRESHVAVDGELRELEEPFSNGLMFPCDPSGKAEEVINCRCALLQRARWAVGDGFTKWNNFTRQLETFDSPQQYDEFKKAFFAPENKRYMNYVQQMEKKYGTRDFEKVLDLMNAQEYKHYSRLLAGNPVYNKVEDVVEKITFIPATSVDEAVKYMGRFAQTVKMSGIKNLNSLNEINRTYTDLMLKYPIPEFETIDAGKLKAHVLAAANYRRVSFSRDFLNRPGTYTGYDWNAHIRRNNDTIAEYRQLMTERKMAPQLRKRFETAIRKLEDENRFQRWTVEDPTRPIYSTLCHEYGHAVADVYFGQINGVKACPTYEANIYNTAYQHGQLVHHTYERAFTTGDIYRLSKYGASDDHEFFAECFAARELGETLPDYVEEMLKVVLGK